MNLMNEDALARLEAGLRAQREKLSSAPRPSPALSPADDPMCYPIELPDFLNAQKKSAA
jgi:hypothetical protein